MRNIKYIVIHCAATKEGQEFDISDMDKWHKARGWRMVGYHFFIKLDGEVQIGRLESQIGAHVAGYNKYSIGICYCGGLDSNGKPKDTRTDEQKKSLRKLIYALRDKYPNAKVKRYPIVQGHRDFSPDLDGDGTIEPNEWLKDCPCFDAKTEYKNISAIARDGHNNEVNPEPDKAL